MKVAKPLNAVPLRVGAQRCHCRQRFPHRLFSSATYLITSGNAAKRGLESVVHSFPAAVITVIIGTKMFSYYSITTLMNLSSCCCSFACLLF